jgi:hypothetical protein
MCSIIADNANVLMSLKADSKTKKIKLKLIMSEGGITSDLVKSYLQREFRKFDDIELTDSNPVLNIGCIPLESKNDRGASLGYSLSFVVTETFSHKCVMDITDNSNLTPQEKAMVNQLLSVSMGTMTDHFLLVSDTDPLDKMCKEAAAIIDGKDIQEIRNLYNQINQSTPK